MSLFLNLQLMKLKKKKSSWDSWEIKLKSIQQESNKTMYDTNVFFFFYRAELGTATWKVYKKYYCLILYWDEYSVVSSYNDGKISRNTYQRRTKIIIWFYDVIFNLVSLWWMVTWVYIYQALFNDLLLVPLTSISL